MPNITIVIFDTWFSNDVVIGACKESNNHCITKIKSNRNVTISNKKIFVKFRYFSTSAFISNHKEEKKGGETYYLISDMLNVSSEIVLRDYLARGVLGVFIGKQNKI